MENLIVIIVSCIVGGIIAGLVLGYYLCGEEWKIKLAHAQEDAERANRIWEDTLGKLIIENAQLLEKYTPEIWGQAIQEDTDDVTEKVARIKAIAAIDDIENGLDKFLEDKYPGKVWTSICGQDTDHRVPFNGC